MILAISVISLFELGVGGIVETQQIEPIFKSQTPNDETYHHCYDNFANRYSNDG